MHKIEINDELITNVASSLGLVLTPELMQFAVEMQSLGMNRIIETLRTADPHERIYWGDAILASEFVKLELDANIIT